MGGSRSDVSGAADASLPAVMWHDEGESKKRHYRKEQIEAMFREVYL